MFKTISFDEKIELTSKIKIALIIFQQDNVKQLYKVV